MGSCGGALVCVSSTSRHDARAVPELSCCGRIPRASVDTDVIDLSRLFLVFAERSSFVDLKIMVWSQPPCTGSQKIVMPLDQMFKMCSEHFPQNDSRSTFARIFTGILHVKTTYDWLHASRVKSSLALMYDSVAIVRAQSHWEPADRCCC